MRKLLNLFLLLAVLPLLLVACNEPNPEGPTSVSGVLVDEQGNPVPDHEIHVLIDEFNCLYCGSGVRERALTNAKGQFIINFTAERNGNYKVFAGPNGCYGPVDTFNIRNTYKNSFRIQARPLGFLLLKLDENTLGDSLTYSIRSNNKVVGQAAFKINYDHTYEYRMPDWPLPVFATDAGATAEITWKLSNNGTVLQSKTETIQTTRCDTVLYRISR